MREIASRGLREERRGIESCNQIKDTCKWPRKTRLLRRRKVSLCGESSVMMVCFSCKSTAA